MTEPRIYTEADWRVLDSLKLRNLTALEGITEQVNTQIIRELSDGINAGESIPKLSKRLQESVDMGKRRATTMARTETINACVDGARVRYEQYGVKEFTYIAASDSRTCQQCAELDGKVFKLTDNAHMPPLHPNCRCCIGAVLHRGEVGKTQDTTTPKTNTHNVSYAERTDLTPAEKIALASYQDIGNPQHEWECPVPVDNQHKDCYVINESLRNPAFRESLSKHDRQILDYLILTMDSAIAKSVVPHQTDIFRGLSDPTWIEKHSLKSEFIDDAYGSFALDLAVAKQFAGPNKDGESVFVFRTLMKGDNAAYIGTAEEEMLVARGRRYSIDKILHYEKDELVDDHKAIVYYLIEV